MPDVGGRCRALGWEPGCRSANLREIVAIKTIRAPGCKFAALHARQARLGSAGARPHLDQERGERRERAGSGGSSPAPRAPPPPPGGTGRCRASPGATPGGGGRLPPPAFVAAAGSCRSCPARGAGAQGPWAAAAKRVPGRRGAPQHLVGVSFSGLGGILYSQRRRRNSSFVSGCELFVGRRAAGHGQFGLPLCSRQFKAYKQISLSKKTSETEESRKPARVRRVDEREIWRRKSLAARRASV